jgi:hypothetical protein
MSLLLLPVCGFRPVNRTDGRVVGTVFRILAHHLYYWRAQIILPHPRAWRQHVDHLFSLRAVVFLHRNGCHLSNRSVIGIRSETNEE